MLAVGMGVLLFLFSKQNRSVDSRRQWSGLICAIAVGIMITLWADGLTSFTLPNRQHTAGFYVTVSAAFPALLVLAAMTSTIRWGATLAASIYMLTYIVTILVLPLFPAQPKLAPIFNPVEHMVPPAFPMLLVLPAVAIDLSARFFLRFAKRRQSLVLKEEQVLRHKRWQDWQLAGLFAFVFLIIAFPVQWNFSAFLLSDAADNRLFVRSTRWAYFIEPSNLMYEFWRVDENPVTSRSLVVAFAVAFASARLGLYLSRYLMQLKR
jgi:hypothetical protein